MNLGCVPENNGLTEKLSEDYRVFLNGRECPVYTARVSAVPFAKIWFDKRDIKYTEISSMVRFDGEGEAEVRVLSLKKKGSAVVRPLGRGVRCYETPEGYVFRLTQPGQYTFEVGDDRGALCLFFDPPQTKPRAGGLHLLFRRGHSLPRVDPPAKRRPGVYRPRRRGVRVAVRGGRPGCDDYRNGRVGRQF